MRLCTASDSDGSWFRPDEPSAQPQCQRGSSSQARSNLGIAAGRRAAIEGKGCTSGQCRNFVDRYEWRPHGCALTRWHAPRFCDQLGRRTLLFIGDSTIDQASAAVANSVSWGGGSCDRQIMYANADTLVRRRFGASNRGRPWTEWVKKAVAQYGLKSLVVVLGASAHIYGDNNFTSVLHDVASSAALRFPGLRLIWMTSIGAGCGSKPLDRPPGAAFWSGYASDAPLFNWREFASRDRLARRFFAARNVSVLDLQPLHMRVDARVSSPTQSWGASGVDCLHFCDTALRLIPTLLHHLLVIEPLSAAAQEHEEEEAATTPRALSKPATITPSSASTAAAEASFCRAIRPPPPCVANSRTHAPRCAVAKHRIVGERLAQLTCLAEMEVQAGGLRDALRLCCNASAPATMQERWRAPEIMKWPHAYLTAISALRGHDERPIDFSFIGSMGGDSLTTARRQWVLSFARQHFSNASYYVDTTPNLPRDYKPLGAWDRTLIHGKGFRPKDPSHTGSRLPCARAACDLSYLSVLARSRYTLAPAGDQPWSHRYFEAVMAGSIPIVETHLHAGRTPVERQLEYHHIVASDVPSAAGRRPGGGLVVVAYCEKHAAENAAKFVRMQTMGQRRIAPSLDGCRAPPFELATSARARAPGEAPAPEQEGEKKGRIIRAARPVQAMKSRQQQLPQHPAASSSLKKPTEQPRRRVIGHKG